MKKPSMLLLVRPKHFGYNPETAQTNSFMHQTSSDVQAEALAEFDGLVHALREAEIAVEIIEDQPHVICPDAVFPNNWFSTHDGHTLILYPMAAPTRRAERRSDIEQLLRTKYCYNKIIDLTHHEKENRFLEGTGSLVLDHAHKMAYCAFSPRTDQEVVLDFCEQLGFLPLAFYTANAQGQPIYHTNVLLAIGDDVAILCTDVIRDDCDKRAVVRMLEVSGKTIIEISEAQMNQFCGNVLFVRDVRGEARAILSQGAWQAFHAEQRALLEQFAKPVLADLRVIERVGGGGARCMLAEIR